MKEVMEEVAAEQRVEFFHNVLGCQGCYLDPHSRHISYCPRSVYNPFQPSHICLVGIVCTCDNALADVDSY